MSVARHLNVFAAAWAEETHRRKADRQRFRDTEFLPAALEIAETPPSPIGRLMLWAIFAAATLALLWACLSPVETVAVAEGRIVPRGRLQTVDASDAGTVRGIYVREGQHVRAGQILVELDPTAASADAQAARIDYLTAERSRARADALLSFSGGGGAPSARAAGLGAEREVVQARIGEYQARIASLKERRLAAVAAADVARQQVLKLEETLPLAEQQLQARKTLEAKGLAPRLKVMEAEQAVIGARRDLEIERARLREAEAQVGMLDRESAQAAAEFRGAAAREKSDAEAIVATRAEAVKKADQRESLQRLVAPVDGVVLEVAVTSVGEFAQPGKTIVTIVPEGEELIVEALLLNRDAGAVKAGDPVVVKLEAFPFTRYGTAEGVLEDVSPDAVADERRGLVFPARVRILKNNLKVDRPARALRPGMTATVEVVTGRRRVIEFLWSPVAKATQEAGRER